MGEGRCVYRVLVEKPEGKKPLGRLGHRWEVITLWWIFNKCDVGVWTGLNWLRIENLWMWEWTFVFHKMRGIAWLAANRLASQEGLCCMEQVNK
jgi:hypothetical protein